MARLNEAPLAPTESVEALKRRFIRQNRELAKNNSAQCLRIRALECDISRLLSENLNLREEVLHLQTALDAAQYRVDATASVKGQLESKLRDVGALVAELVNLQQKPPPLHTDIDPNSWRPEVPIAALSSQTHRMSIIDEESLSLPRLSEQSNESPDIGPPPIARFDCDDAIKFDPSPATATDLSQDSDNINVIPPSLSVNLETRRRRRDINTNKQDIISPSSPVAAVDECFPSVKSSTKRKLSIRDAEDADLKAIEDDFIFSRRASVTGDAKKCPVIPESAVEITNSHQKPLSDERPTIAPPVERRVLGEKSVNMSPRKGTGPRGGKAKGTLVKPEKPLKDSRKDTGHERKPRVSASIEHSHRQEQPVQSIELPMVETEAVLSAPPKTPAPELFSPTGSESCTSRNDARDTPPPPAFGSARPTTSDISGASRPSRRARAAVNYAEPNLISKMRRSEKPAGDGAGANLRRSSSNVPDSESKRAGRTVVIKQEDSVESKWKVPSSGLESERSEPTSPLGEKSNTAVSRGPSSETASIAQNRGALRTEIKMEETSRKMEDLNLYDNSSPPPIDSEADVQKTSTRRHSTMTETKRRTSKIQTQLSGMEHDPARGIQDVGASRRADRTRRRSMMV